MILELAHTRLEVYKYSRQLVIECYRLTRDLPSIERFNLIQQINRAALSVILNLAEGSSRRSFVERRRFFEISRASIVEIDAAIQVCIDLNYFNEANVEKIKPVLISCFRMFSKLISN
jgi:four helix bundle protein